MTPVPLLAMAELLPDEGSSNKTPLFCHVYSPKKKAGFKWVSFLIVIVSLLVGEDDGSVVVEGDPPPEQQHTTLERGKVIGNRVTADTLYDAYKEVQHDYYTKAFNAKQPWKILNRKDGVEISMLQHKSDPNCPYVRMKAIISASVKDCWNFLMLDNWDRTMPKMDPFYEGVDLYGEFNKRGVNMILARKRTKHIVGFAKRDFVFISVSDLPLRDGTWVSGSVSVVTPLIQRTQGYSRAFQDSIAFYKPLSPTRTEITIVCRIDLNDSLPGGAGGNIPMWLYVKTIGTTGSQSVLSMKKALEADLDEQEEMKKKGMQFSVPWQVPILPDEEEQRLAHEREKQRRRHEKAKREAERMRFSVPGKLPILPMREDDVDEDDKDEVPPFSLGLPFVHKNLEQQNEATKQSELRKGIRFPWVNGSNRTR